MAKLKKLTALLMTVILAASLAGCGGDTEEDTTQGTTEGTTQAEATTEGTDAEDPTESADAEDDKYPAFDMGGRTMYDCDMTLPLAIVIGAEGEGVSRQVRELCDFTVSVPQKGRIESLNASNASAVLLYEAFRQRDNR